MKPSEMKKDHATSIRINSLALELLDITPQEIIDKYIDENIDVFVSKRRKKDPNRGEIVKNDDYQQNPKERDDGKSLKKD